ncbi:MAG: lysophospholipid acyltransferase family protein, partial [Gemmataceae bacterium]
MAARPRRPAADYAVYLLVRFAVAVIQALPWSAAEQLADALAWLAHALDRRHREAAADNLRHAFPELPPARTDALVRASYRHLFTVLIEMVRLPREVRPANVLRKLRFQDPATLERAAGFRDSGRPLIVVTGHFGNWEALGYATGMAGFTANVIARRLDNPHLDAYLGRFRAATGQTVLDKNTDFDKIVDVLERGGRLAALADQDAGPRGEFVT